MILLQDIVEKQKDELRTRRQGREVDRTLSSPLSKALELPLIKVILGPRRAGKSTLAHQVLEGKKYAYFNFEDEDLSDDLRGSDLLSALDRVYPDHEYILFDEIQLLKNWEKFLNRLERSGRNLVVTGSNSRLLSGELASSLTGRYFALELLPFSYPEFIKARGAHDSDSVFLDYLKSGGYAAVVLNPVVSNDYLNALWDAIILKDVVARYKIRKVDDIKNLLTFVLMQFTSKSTGHSLEKLFNQRLKYETILKYIGYAENAYLISYLQNYSLRQRRRVSSPRKTYLFDNGFYTARKNSPMKDQGKLLENLVFAELYRRGYKSNLNLMYYTTSNNYEVDFLTIEEGKPHTCYQVAYDVSHVDTMNREIRSLVEAEKELGVRKLRMVVATGHSRIIDVKGSKIELIPARKFFIES